MARPVTVVLEPSGEVVEARPGDRLLDLVHSAGVALEAVCGGAGECGKCRVFVSPPDAVEEAGSSCRHAPTADERAAGCVLACRAALLADCTVSVPVESRIVAPKILVPDLSAPGALDPAVRQYRVAVEADPFQIGASVRLDGYGGPRPAMEPALLARLRGAGNDCFAIVH